MDTLIIFGAKYLIYIVALAAVAAVLVSPQRNRLALLAIIALPVAYALARIAGALFAHPQPFVTSGVEPLIPHAVDNSFPSDHTLFAGVFASVATLAERRVGLALWALALLVGAARILAELHYPVDILASIALSLVVVWITQKSLKHFGLY